MSKLQSRPHAVPPLHAGRHPDKFRIFAIGGQNFSVDGLTRQLETRDHRYTVSCMPPDEACLTKFAAAQPDALLIENESLPEPAERFIEEARQHHPDVRILVIGEGMSDDYLYRLVGASVHGYINERVNGEHFARALEHVLDGNTWVERHIMERFIESRRGFEESLEARFSECVERLCGRLTRREMEILREVVKGLAIKQIAESVHLSHQGVKMHLAKLFKKFNVNNRNQLILAAFDEVSPVEKLSGLLRSGLNKQLTGKAADN